MRTHRSLLVLVLAAAVALLWLALDAPTIAPGDAPAEALPAGARAGEEKAEPQPSAGAPEPAVAAADPTLDLDFAGRYQLELVSDYTSPGPSGRNEPGDLVLTATLELARDPDRPSADRELVGRLTGAQALAHGAHAVTWSGPSAQAHLERPFVWRGLARSGEVHLRPDVPAAIGCVLTTMLSAIEVAGGGGGEPTWTATHRALDGESEAMYRLDGDHLSKRWHRTFGATPWSKEGDALQTVKGETRFRLADGPGGRVVADVEHILETSFNLALDPRAPFSAHSKLKLRLTRLGAGPDVAGIGLERASVTPFAPAPPAVPSRAVPGQDHPVRTLMANSAAAHGRRDYAARAAAQRALGAKLREDPETARDVEALLRGAAQAGLDRRTALGALGEAATPEAQEVLAHALGEEGFDEVVQQGAATVMTFLPTPAAGVLDVLRQQADGWDGGLVGEAALLALAGQAHLQAGKDPELSAVLAGEMFARAEAGLGLAPSEPTADLAGNASNEFVAPEPPDPTADPVGHKRRVWLEVLGALGGPKSFALVRPFLRDPSTLTRAVAFRALRFVNLPEARSLAAEGLLGDPEPVVRRAAIAVARNQPRQAFEETVLEALRTDSHPHVKVDAAHLVAVWAYTSPALHTHLLRAIERETDPKVRRGLQDLWPSFAGVPMPKTGLPVAP